MLIKPCEVKAGVVSIDGKRYPVYKTHLGRVTALTDLFNINDITYHMVHILSYKKINSVAYKKQIWKYKVHPGKKDDKGIYRRYFIIRRKII